MKFQFDVSEVIPKQITIITAHDIIQKKKTEKLMSIIDDLGFASAKAQKLKGPITTLMKLQNNPDQRLYIMREENETKSTKNDFYFASGGVSGYKDLVNAEKYSIVGMLKVGVKTLFVVDELGRQIEINPLCVLDFYIDESLQKKGYGKRLFDYMLQMEFISPQHLAYDRPSHKLLSFLKKYYALEDYIPQPNNYVLFNEYGLQYLELDHRGQVKKTRTIKTPAQKVEECKKFKEKRFAALNKRGSFIKGLEEDIQQVNDPIAERNGIEKASGLETVAEVDTFVHTQTPKLTSKYSLVLPPINQVNASPLGSVANLATPVPPAVSMPPVNAVPNELPIPNPNQFQASSVAHTPTAPVNYTPTPAPAVNLAPTPEVNLKYPTIQQQPYSSIPQNQYPQQFSKDTDYNNETTQFANPRMFRKIISNNQEAERQARVMKIIEAQKRVSVDPLSEFKKQVYQTQRYSKYSRFQYSNINR